jgi:hypothetical protein
VEDEGSTGERCAGGGRRCAGSPTYQHGVPLASTESNVILSIMESDPFSRAPRLGSAPQMRPEDAVGPSEAAANLAAAHESRSWLADRAIAPWWYNPIFGALNGGLISMAAARSSVLFAWSVVGYTFACGALMWWNQRRVGVWIQHHHGLENVVFIGQVLALGGVAGLACWLGLAHGLIWPFFVAGALALVLTVVFGKVTDTVLRAKLVAGP